MKANPVFVQGVESGFRGDIFDDYFINRRFLNAVTSGLVFTTFGARIHWTAHQSALAAWLFRRVATVESDVNGFDRAFMDK